MGSTPPLVIACSSSSFTLVSSPLGSSSSVPENTPPDVVASSSSLVLGSFPEVVGSLSSSSLASSPLGSSSFRGVSVHSHLGAEPEYSSAHSFKIEKMEFNPLHTFEFWSLVSSFTHSLNDFRDNHNHLGMKQRVRGEIRYEFVDNFNVCKFSLCK
jgi:hypothetical protein